MAAARGTNLQLMRPSARLVADLDNIERALSIYATADKTFYAAPTALL
jgi:hypothetical protein